MVAGAKDARSACRDKIEGEGVLSEPRMVRRVFQRGTPGSARAARCGSVVAGRQAVARCARPYIKKVRKVKKWVVPQPARLA